jgi:hypothetical protein
MTLRRIQNQGVVALKAIPKNNLLDVIIPQRAKPKRNNPANEGDYQHNKADGHPKQTGTNHE